MHKINKFTDDLLLGLELECQNGCFNLRQFKYFEIRLFTLDSNNYVVATYEQNQPIELINIIEVQDQFFVRINQPELENLENGQLRCIIHYSLIDINFDDGTYDASDAMMIDQWITDREEKINVITKGGCC